MWLHHRLNTYFIYDYYSLKSVDGWPSSPCLRNTHKRYFREIFFQGDTCLTFFVCLTQMRTRLIFGKKKIFFISEIISLTKIIQLYIKRYLQFIRYTKQIFKRNIYWIIRTIFYVEIQISITDDLYTIIKKLVNIKII